MACCGLLVVAEGGSLDVVQAVLPVIIHSGPGICGGGVKRKIQGPCIRNSACASGWCWEKKKQKGLRHVSGPSTCG